MRLSNLALIALALSSTGCVVATGAGSGAGGASEKKGGGFLCPTRHAVVREAAMPCAEANRTAAAAIKRLGYTITDFSAASAGEPGSIVGVRGDQWGDPSKEFTASVTITCSARGAVVDAVTNESCGAQLTFPNQFRESFTVSKARKVRRPSIVPKEEQTGLRITVEPQRDADEELAVDLSGAGMMSVKVTIHNRTSRTYVLDPNAVVLISEGRQRVRGVSPQKVADKVTDGGEAARARLRDLAIRDQVIAPGATLTGYVYVPRQAYRSARITLMDQEAEESEGFLVQF